MALNYLIFNSLFEIVLKIIFLNLCQQHGSEHGQSVTDTDLIRVMIRHFSQPSRLLETRTNKPCHKMNTDLTHVHNTDDRHGSATDTKLPSYQSKRYHRLTMADKSLIKRQNQIKIGRAHV